MFSKVRKVLCLITIGSVLVISALVLVSPEFRPFSRSADSKLVPAAAATKTQSENAAKRNKTRPLILYWGNPWGMPGQTPPEGSEEGECLNTNKAEKLDKADIVVFHYTVMHKGLVPWPHYRDPHQAFVWWSAENPAIAGTDFSAYDGFFNWTWTYRLDADVHRGYGFRDKALKAVNRGPKVVDDLVVGKKKLAIWFASNCKNTRGGVERLKYSNQLIEAGLPLERIGRCFGNQQLLPRNKPDEMARLVRETKFYMAFENAIHCTDYLTEKFWDTALQNGAVPVVWGTSKHDVLRVAPIDSFIHVEDFETPKMLADYLRFLDGNETEYRKYLRWRADENVTDEQMVSMIEKKYPGVEAQRRPKTLCEVFHDNNRSRVIESLNDEFVKRNPEECFKWRRRK